MCLHWSCPPSQPLNLRSVCLKFCTQDLADRLQPLRYHLKGRNEYILAAFLLSLSRQCVEPCRLGSLCPGSCLSCIWKVLLEGLGHRGVQPRADGSEGDVAFQDCTINFVFPIVSHSRACQEQEEKGKILKEFTFPVLAVTWRLVKCKASCYKACMHLHPACINNFKVPFFSLVSALQCNSISSSTYLKGVSHFSSFALCLPCVSLTASL